MTRFAVISSADEKDGEALKSVGCPQSYEAFYHTKGGQRCGT